MAKPIIGVLKVDFGTVSFIDYASYGIPFLADNFTIAVQKASIKNHNGGGTGGGGWYGSGVGGHNKHNDGIGNESSYIEGITITPRTGNRVTLPFPIIIREDGFVRIGCNGDTSY